jgi:hypothetical protein
MNECWLMLAEECESVVKNNDLCLNEKNIK